MTNCNIDLLSEITCEDAAYDELLENWLAEQESRYDCDDAILHHFE